jgi:hypothetical protein
MMMSKQDAGPTKPVLLDLREAIGVSKFVFVSPYDNV